MRKWWNELLSILVIVCLCLLTRYSSAGVQAGNRHGGDSSYSDSYLEDTVTKTLARNPSLTLVQASVSHRTITLSGVVDHYSDKLNAEAAIRQLPGVDRVESTIDVATASVDDSVLQNRIEDRLHFGRADLGITFPHVQVQTHQGIVTLSGTVQDPIEHAVALTLAGSVDGVLSVRDNLRITKDSFSLNHDDILRTEINKVIYQVSSDNPRVQSDPLRMKFENGIVELAGAVAGEKEKQALVTAVDKIYGVICVEDNLIVRASHVKKVSDECSIASPKAQYADSKE